MWGFMRGFKIMLLCLGWALPLMAEKVATLDLCADQWALWLLDKKEIGAITYLAADDQQSFFAGRTAKIPQHDGQVEKLLKLKIKTVIADGFLSPYKKTVLETAGIEVILLPTIQSMADIEKRKRFFEKRFQITVPPEVLPVKHPLKKRALFLNMGGSVAGAGTILNDLMEDAGFFNVAQYIKMWAPMTLEKMITLVPDVIFYLAGQSQTSEMTLVSATHPVIKKRGIKGCPVALKNAICSVPPAIQALRAELLACSEETGNA